jgi:secretion/DNA translocation related CpaE-like protein
MSFVDSQPLLLVRDPELRGELDRFCAAAGLDPEIVDRPELARRSWTAAPCVLVGDECAADVASLGLARRSDVVLVALEPETAEMWRRGLSIHADHVAVLPHGQQWLISWLVEARDRGSGDGVAVGVMSGRGGAGSSTYAVALGLEAAARELRTVLIDGDPLGGGLDLLVGCEESPGLRWPDVGAAGGRVSAAALRSALPSMAGLAVLSSTGFGTPDLLDVRNIVASARRGADLVIVDLPRSADRELLDVVAGLDVVVVVTTDDVRAVAGARQVIGALLPSCNDVRVAVRTAQAFLLPPDDVAAALGVPLASVLATRRATQRAIDEGLGPALRSRDRRRLRRLLDSLVVARTPAALAGRR